MKFRALMAHYRKMSLPEIKEFLTAQGVAFDADEDRRLTEQEFVSGCQRLGFQITDAEAREDFHSIDTNHGGYVLFEEFCCWAGQRPLGRCPGSRRGWTRSVQREAGCPRAVLSVQGVGSRSD